MKLRHLLRQRNLPALLILLSATLLFIGKARWEVAENEEPSDWSEHKATLAARKPFRNFILGRRVRTGELRYSSNSGEPRFDKNGVFRGYHGVSRDVTEEKRAEEALRQSEARFRALTELSSDWYWEQDEAFRFTVMSHNLGNTGGGVTNLAHIGKTRWDMPALNLSENDWRAHRAALAREVAERLQQQQPDRRVQVEIPHCLPVEGDADMMHMVVENLLGNAWKYSGREELTLISLSAVPPLLQSGPLVYCVRDNGAGFDMAYSGKLFQPFERLHGEGEFPGLGTGLATVRKIVERHGGRIGAESAPDSGTAMFFTLWESRAPGEVTGGPARRKAA